MVGAAGFSSPPGGSGLDPFRKSRRVGSSCKRGSNMEASPCGFPVVRCEGSQLLHLHYSHPQCLKSVPVRTIDTNKNEQSVASCEPSERRPCTRTRVSAASSGARSDAMARLVEGDKLAIFSMRFNTFTPAKPRSTLSTRSARFNRN